MIRCAPWAAMVAALLCSATRLEAAVVWHDTLAAAKAASVASQRPVLVVFTAGWSEASDRFVQRTLAAPEATAIVSSCFEPVRLDVDANGDLAKRLGVSHLPSACIVDQNDAVLSRFDCSDSSVEFVSNAARAIQTAAQARVTAASVAGPAAAPAAQAAATPSPAIQPPPAATAPATSRFGSAEPTVAPPLPATPPAWPAQPASAPLDQSGTSGGQLSAFSSAASQPPAVPPRQVIEPQATAAPWAASQPSAPAAATTTPAPSTPMAGGSYPTTYPTTATAAPASPTPGVVPPAPSYPSTYPTTYPQTAAAPPAYQGVAPGVAGGLPIYSGSAAVTAASPRPALPTPPTEKPQTSNAFVAFFQDPTAFFTKSSSKPAASDAIAKPSASVTPQPATPRNPSIASQSPIAAASASADGLSSMPVGLEGYCPVTLVEKSIWVEGRPQWGVRHRGRTYLFAGPAEQQAFLAVPDRYSPALSGDDPVLALDSGRQVPGQRRYGVTYQSRVYLFSSPETRTAFTVAPDRYVTRVLVAENPQASSGTLIR